MDAATRQLLLAGLADGLKESVKQIMQVCVLSDDADAPERARAGLEKAVAASEAGSG
jgi:hypothetical protein